MSATFYLLMHFFGLFTVMVAIGSVAYQETLGGEPGPEHKRMRTIAMGEHGLGLVLMLVSGFGLLAKLGIHGIPNWIWAKLGIWIVLAAAPFLIRRFFRGKHALLVWVALPWIGVLAAYLAIKKSL